MKLKKTKTYVVRKFVEAVSAMDAIRKEKGCQVDDVWVHQEQVTDLSPAIGFEQTSIEEE